MSSHTDSIEDAPVRAKFKSPAFFPEGTVVEITLPFRPVDEERVQQHTVGRIFRNGFDSYVIETTTLRNSHFFSPGSKESFNTEHVTRIIKRGTGPLKVDENYFNPSTTLIRDTYHKHMYMWDGLQRKRGHLISLNPQELIAFYLGDYVPDGSVRDLDEAARKALAAGVIRRDNQQPFLRYFTASSKKLKRWVKRNANRCLTNKKAAVREYEAEMRRLDEDAMEREYRQQYNEDQDAAPADEEGSCYDWDDGPYSGECDYSFLTQTDEPR